MDISESPRVSVIIPNFNRDYCLGRAIQSIVDQTIKNWELIVVDNNSTDGSLEVINAFADTRISIAQRDNHGIIAHSRNVRISKATDAYTVLLDSGVWVSSMVYLISTFNRLSALYWVWIFFALFRTNSITWDSFIFFLVGTAGVLGQSAGVKKHVSIIENRTLASNEFNS